MNNSAQNQIRKVEVTNENTAWTLYKHRIKDALLKMSGIVFLAWGWLILTPPSPQRADVGRRGEQKDLKTFLGVDTKC